MKISDTYKLLIIYLSVIFGMILFSSCNKDEFDGVNELNIDTRLPKDGNGYSVFNLYSQQTQNIHTISGSVRRKGRIPDNPRQRIEWESSHYWQLNVGDTIGRIYRRTWRGLGWQIVDSIEVVNLKQAQVPTINSVSYNSADGTISTVIAPMWNMRGDTMTIVARSNGVVKIEKIILK